MSLQMSLVFTLLISEMTLLSILILPLPTKIQNSVVNFSYKIIQYQNIKIGTLFTSAIVGLLFLDSFKNSFPNLLSNSSDDIIDFNMKERNNDVWDNRSKKFYSQRNLYINGAVLFCELAIVFNILMLKSMVKNKKLLIDLDSKKKRTTDASITDDENNTELIELNKELKKNQLDVDTLQKQYDGLWKAYNDKKTKENESEIKNADKTESKKQL